jgi:hypothetical protein
MARTIPKNNKLGPDPSLVIAAIRMRLQPTTLLLGFLLAASCAQRQGLAPAAPRAAKTAARVHPPATAAASEPEAAAVDEPRVPSHAVGDYIVRRFSMRSHPATTLTERVVAVKDASIVVDVTREAGAKTRTVRVELSDLPGNRGEVLGASILRAGVEIPMGKAVYGALMKDTVFAADENEGQIESASTTHDVHGRSLDCTETSFRVKVQGRSATMRTLELVNSPWGEVGAEVTSAEGTVLYRAEVVDVGHDELRAVAVQEN